MNSVCPAAASPTCSLALASARSYGHKAPVFNTLPALYADRCSHTPVSSCEAEQSRDYHCRHAYETTHAAIRSQRARPLFVQPLVCAASRQSNARCPFVADDCPASSSQARYSPLAPSLNLTSWCRGSASEAMDRICRTLDDRICRPLVFASVQAQRWCIALAVAHAACALPEVRLVEPSPDEGLTTSSHASDPIAPIHAEGSSGAS